MDARPDNIRPMEICVGTFRLLVLHPPPVTSGREADNNTFGFAGNRATIL
jgi:hypothetical protein